MEDAFNTYELLKHPVPAPPPNAPPRLERSRTPCCTAASLLHVPATIPPVLPRPPLRASEERTCACISQSLSRSQAECGSLCDYTDRRRGRGRA